MVAKNECGDKVPHFIAIIYINYGEMVYIFFLYKGSTIHLFTNRKSFGLQTPPSILVVLLYHDPGGLGFEDTIIVY